MVTEFTVICIISPLFLFPRDLSYVMVKASASRAGDRGSIPGHVLPKSFKMEF